MDPILLKTHDELIREADRAFDVARKLTTTRQRQEPLFEKLRTSDLGTVKELVFGRCLVASASREISGGRFMFIRCYFVAMV